MIDPQTPLSRVGEKAFLEHLERRIPLGPGVVLGVGDDAAALEGLVPKALVTTDSLVEGIHFRREWAPPRLLGRKALSVNLSDVAAMGGTPRHATVSLCLPADTTFGFVDELYDGLLERAAENAVNLVGGNVTSTTGPVVIDITLLGQGDGLLTRRGARPGDRILVTGSLGAAAAGLMLLGQGVRVDAEGALASLGPWTESSAGPLLRCLLAVLDPRPPIGLGRSLGEAGVAHAAIDVSDGLSSDLRRLCEASGLCARVDAFRIPVDESASVVARARGREALDLALHSGEEYQLLLAVPEDRVEEATGLALVWHVDLTDIGAFEEGDPDVFLRTATGMRSLLPGGHDHFAGVEIPAPGQPVR